MQAVYENHYNVSDAFTFIQNSSGVSEEFLYALFNGQKPAPISFVSAEKRKRADDLVSKGWKEQYALEWVTGRIRAVEFFLLYKKQPAEFFRLLYSQIRY